MTLPINLSTTLLKYLYDQTLFIKVKNDLPFRWHDLYQDAEYFKERKEYFDNYYNTFFINGSAPIIHHFDDYILEHNGKYILIHDSYPDVGWAIENIQFFNTPQEVWEKVIKPDIEAYYDN